MPPHGSPYSSCHQSNVYITYSYEKHMITRSPVTDPNGNIFLLLALWKGTTDSQKVGNLWKRAKLRVRVIANSQIFAPHALCAQSTQLFKRPTKLYFPFLSTCTTPGHSPPYPTPDAEASTQQYPFLQFLFSTGH